MVIHFFGPYKPWKKWNLKTFQYYNDVIKVIDKSSNQSYFNKYASLNKKFKVFFYVLACAGSAKIFAKQDIKSIFKPLLIFLNPRKDSHPTDTR